MLLQFDEEKSSMSVFLKEQVIKVIPVDVTTYKIRSNNSHLSFSKKRKIRLRVIAKSNLHPPLPHLNPHFLGNIPLLPSCALCKKSCFATFLIDSFYTLQRITVILQKNSFCLAHISHLPILIQLKEVRMVWPMNEPYFSRGHLDVNWNIPSTNSQPVTSDLQLFLFWKVTAWSPKRQRILNAGKLWTTVQNCRLISKGFKTQMQFICKQSVFILSYR